MKTIEAVILDWAGTTVDYGSFAPVQAFMDGFGRFGITPTIAEVREPMGMLKWDHIHTMMQMPRIGAQWKSVHGSEWSRIDVDAVYRASENAVMDILHNFSTPKPYVLETVEMLRSQDIKIGSTTGYTDAMMQVVVPAAAAQGYTPDAWFTPNAVGNLGRPYPYMIFKNMETLKISSVQAVIKVGDTVADIREGKNAGMMSVGVIEGSSVMGLTQSEYEALTPAEKESECARVRAVFLHAGADDVIRDIRQLGELIQNRNR